MEFNETELTPVGKQRIRRSDRIRVPPAVGCRTPKGHAENIWKLKCPECHQALACCRWHPAAVSILQCVRGCGTYRYLHRRALLRRSPAVHRPASPDGRLSADAPIVRRFGTSGERACDPAPDEPVRVAR